MANKQNKRGHGEGCITQRSDGTWAAVITLGKDANGKQTRRFFYGRTRKSVAEKLSKALNEINTGMYVNPDKSTLNDWLLFWMQEYVENKVKLSTKISYDTFVHRHINPVIGNIPLSTLRGDMIQKFYNDKLRDGGRLDGKKGGLSPKTIKNLHNMLHGALEQAVMNGILMKNACKTVTLPKVTKKEMRVLSPEEQQKLIDIARTDRLGIGIVLTLFTGIRLGELLGLQWKDLSEGILSVRQTLNRLKNFDDDNDKKTSIVIGDTKTFKSKRQIPLHELMISELKKFKTLQKQEKLRAGELYENTNFIIVNELGNFIEPRTYQDLFYKLIKKAGIPKANFHCLRHTFATRALERGVAAKTVSELLGHANISTTLDLYSHVSHDLKKESIDKMADLFIQATK